MNDFDQSTMQEHRNARLPRRALLKWFAAAGAAGVVDWPRLRAAEVAEVPAPAVVTTGYGTDPDLVKIYQPGDVWPLLMTPAQKAAAVAFADLLFPADPFGPAASEVRVADCVDEWISAPYEPQAASRAQILTGLDWLDEESGRRFGKPVPEISTEELAKIADDICWPADADDEFQMAAGFFQSFRAIAGGAYYTSEAGWKAIGYVGNVPLVSFEGPPQEVLDQLGVEAYPV